MKTNKLLTIALLWTLVISWSAFASDTNLTWNITTVQSTKQDITTYRTQLKELHNQLKLATNHEEKFVIRNKIYELTKEIVAKYPKFISTYTHRDFHFNERNQLSWFRNEIRTQRQELKTWFNEERKNMWQNRKNNLKEVKKTLNKDTKQQIKEIFKKYHWQIQTLKSQITTLKKQIKQSKDKTTKQQIWSQIKTLWTQIKQLRIQALTEIKSLVPIEQQAKIQTAIDNMQNTWNDIQTKKEDFKKEIETKKTDIYNNISVKVKSNIDNAISKLQSKLNSLSKDKQVKLLTHIQKRITKIIANHVNDTKINHNWIHFKTELWILNYLKNNIDTMLNKLNQ